MKRVIFVTILSILFAQNVVAQSTDTLRDNLHKRNIFTLVLYKQPGKDSMVDFVDGVYRVFNIKKERSQDEHFDKPHFVFIPGAEYSLATGMSASVNADLIFPSTKNNTHYSTIFSELKYTQNKQVIAQFATNLWLMNDEYNVNTNWSYLKYPQLDFGLGSQSTLQLVDNLDYSYLKLHQSILKKIAPNLYFGPGLNIDYHWNISDTTTLNKPIVGAKQYGLGKNSNSVGILLNLVYDTRKKITNPVANSAYFNISYRDNLTALGSDSHWQSLIIDYRKYIPFPKDSKNILAFWSYNMFTLQGKSPYLDMPFTASDLYNNFGRGYIQGRFRGNNLVYAESEYRFGITENGLIGGVVFANFESVSQQQGKSLQSILPGYGAGLRIKFSKHSNTNVALDYGFGQGGSKGLFMNLGEVF